MFEAGAGTTAPRTAPRHAAASAPGPDTAASLPAVMPVPLRSWAERHPLAADLEDAAPGPALAARLTGIEVADVDDTALLEVAAGWERIASWAAAEQARAVRELHRRREAARCERFVADEVAVRLGATRALAESKVGLALGLDQLPAVADALAAGKLDARKAGVLLDELVTLSPEAAARVADAVLPEAEQLTAPQLKARIRRLEISRDPDGAERRHAGARADRHVSLDPTHDSMAWLSAYLPADDATAVFTALTALADAADPQDERPLGARRADALVDLATHLLDGGGPAGLLPAQQGRRPHLQVTAAATTLLGLDREPATLEGYGPIVPSMARRIAARSTWRPLLVDAESGTLLQRGATTYRPPAPLAGEVVDRDVTCTFPGCRIPAARCDLDHIRPFDRTRPAAGQTHAANLQSLCRHHHLAKTHAAWSAERDTVTGSTSWRAPTGHLYERPPARTDPRVPGEHARGGPDARDDEDPPGLGASGSAKTSGREDAPSGDHAPAEDPPPPF